jgi:hypothetical protein
MKLILIIAAGVLLASLVAWAAYDTENFRHTFFGYSKAEQNKAWTEYQTTVARSNRVLDERFLESEIGLIELRHGEMAASKYRRCRTDPPTTEFVGAPVGLLFRDIHKTHSQLQWDPWLQFCAELQFGHVEDCGSGNLDSLQNQLKSLLGSGHEKSGDTSLRT